MDTPSPPDSGPAPDRDRPDQDTPDRDIAGGDSRPPAWLSDLRRSVTTAWAGITSAGDAPRRDLSATSTLIRADALDWLPALPAQSVHAIVTDPPYGLVEYSDKNQTKLRAGKGGVWRIPPSWDGARRQPLPRFTVLSKAEADSLHDFFHAFAAAAIRVLAPGGHLILASNPLLSSTAFFAVQQAGFEKRAEIIRLVQTLRGGDRPKGAETDFPDVTVMPRSCWEPWGLFRKPFPGPVAANLRRWGTGGLRRVSAAEPFRDVIPCSPTRGRERAVVPHPSLKPQKFLRQVVRAALPLGVGIVLDPFAGGASTLAAAEALGYHAIGIERDAGYFDMACAGFPDLASMPAPA